MISPLLRALFAHIVIDFALRASRTESKRQYLALFKQKSFWLSLAAYSGALLLVLMPQIAVGMRAALLGFFAMFGVRGFVVFAQVFWRSPALRIVWHALQLVAVVLLVWCLTGLSFPWTAVKTALLMLDV